MAHYPRICSASVRGGNHFHAQLPNQDSFAHKIIQHDRWVAAVADGHGSHLHSRSHIGSRLAVQAALAEVLRFYSDERPRTSLFLQEYLPDIIESIVSHWICLVELDLDRSPYQPGLFSSKESELVFNNPLLLYGTTLSFAFSYSPFVYLISIGDSEISWVSRSGSTCRLDLLNGNRYPGEQTDSLCIPRAWEKACTDVVELNETGSVFLHTDGISKSVIDTSELASLFVYYHSQLADDIPLSEVNDDINEQLIEMACHGSGDDCTLLQVFIWE
jgi:hypothetical protein